LLLFCGSADERLLPPKKACSPLTELPYPISVTYCGLVDIRTDLLLRLVLEILEKPSESPLLLSGLSGHLIEPITSSRIAGYRTGFCRELMSIERREEGY
jgi:hypothetical protein